MHAIRTYPRLLAVALALTVAMIPSTRGAPAPGTAAPALVGKLGSPSALKFRGNAAVSAEDLRFQIAGSAEYLKAAHPAAPLPAYLAATRLLLTRGYHYAGFRDARVSAEASKGKLLVEIVEGPQFLKGGIRIEGALTIPVEPLLAGLTQKFPPVNPSHAALVTEFVEKRAATELAAVQAKAQAAAAPVNASLTLGGAKRTLESDEAKITVIEPSVTITKGAAAPELSELSPELKAVFGRLKTQAPPKEPAWIKGTPFPFHAQFLPELQGELERLLSEQGDVLTKVKAEAVVDEQSREVSVVFRLVEAPRPVLGKIAVTGNRRDTAEEVIAVTGLVPGQPFTAEKVRQATLALWNSARFLNFELTPKPRAAGEPEVDLHILVQECPEMQGLAEPLNRQQQAYVRFAQWIMAELPKTDFLLEVAWKDATSASIAYAPLGFGVAARAGGGLFGAVVTGGDALIVSKDGARVAARAFGAAMGTVPFSIECVPTMRTAPPEKSWRSLNFGGGYSSIGFGETTLIAPRFVVAPVTLCADVRKELPAERFRFHGGFVEVRSKDPKTNDEITMKFDEKTGALVEFVGGEHFGAGSVVRARIGAGQLGQLRAELADIAKNAGAAGASESILELAAQSGIKKLVEKTGLNVPIEKYALGLRLVEKAVVAFLVPERPDADLAKVSSAFFRT